MAEPLRIVIVEDDLRICRNLTVNLPALGFEVVALAHDLEGVQEIADRLTSTDEQADPMEPIDAVIMDADLTPARTGTGEGEPTVSDGQRAIEILRATGKVRHFIGNGSNDDIPGAEVNTRKDFGKILEFLSRLTLPTDQPKDVARVGDAA